MDNEIETEYAEPVTVISDRKMSKMLYYGNTPDEVVEENKNDAEVFFEIDASWLLSIS